MIKSKIFIILFIISIFCVLPNFVSAASIEQQTDTIDLRTLDTTNNLDSYGWNWNSQTKTLTLKDADFELTGDEPCFTFNKNENITVIFEGDNTLKAENKSIFYGTGSNTDGTHGSLTFKSPTNGTLNLEITNSDSRGTFNIGNTINYAYDLNIESGTINSRGGFWVDGTVTISGGDVNINTEDMETNLGAVNGIYALVQVKITGGDVDINSNDSAIFVSGTPGAWDNKEDGVILTGGDISLSTQRTNAPVVGAGTLKHKDIIIDGGDITLAGDYGFYTEDGSITVSHIDSLDTTKITKEAFKVAEGEGNEIILAEADYSKVDEAIERANKLNKTDYKDFSAVDNAINAVVRGKNVLEQDKVDDMAKAINDAIDSLELLEKSDELDNTPKTSEGNSSVVALLVLLIFSSVTFLILQRKSRNFM